MAGILDSKEDIKEKREGISFVIINTAVESDLKLDAEPSVMMVKKVSNNSLIKQNYNQIEIIFADAVGNEILKSEIHDECINYHDISQIEFQTMAQLKNYVINLCRFNKVVIIINGEADIEEDLLHKLIEVENADKSLINQQATSKNTVFERVIREGAFNAAAVIVDKNVLSSVGKFNEELSCGEDYELLLRASDKGVEYILNNNEMPVYQELYQTYAYTIGKYSNELKQMGIFDDVFLARYNEAVNYGIKDYFVEQATSMLERNSEYERIDGKTRPVLILSDKKICNGVLDAFARDFSEALINNNQNVVFIDYDISSEEARRICNKDYKAAVGFQTTFFITQLENKDRVGDLLKCPKFNYDFDHPLYISSLFIYPLDNYYVLSQDGNYARYAKKYFKYIKDAWQLPPGGRVSKLLLESDSESNFESDKPADDIDRSISSVNKKYDVTFVASYQDYRQSLKLIRDLPEDEKKVAMKLLNYMKHHMNTTVEDALKIVMDKMAVYDNDNLETIVRLHKLRDVVTVINFYNREKIIKYLLDKDVKIHVFSESWYKSPYASHKNLIIHNDLSYDEGLDIMAQSKVSLNIMSGHKDGMTERVANACLNRTVCVSDKTKYLDDNFTNGFDMILFDLNDYGNLPERIKEICNDDALCNVITENAYTSIKKCVTWDINAKKFLKIVESCF